MQAGKTAHVIHWYYLLHEAQSPAWIKNYTHYDMCDEISYSFPNFNDATVEVWE